MEGNDAMIQFHRESNNCFQDIIAMIIENCGRTSLLIYQGSLNFGYKRNEELFGNRIVPSRDENWLDCSLEESLIDNYGLYLKKMHTSDILQVLHDINTEKIGIILELDVYDCPWHIFGGKYHSPHYCWAIKSDNTYVECVLPYGAKRGYLEVNKVLSKGYVDYFIIEKKENVEEKDLEYILCKAVHNCKVGWNGLSDIQKMEMLRDDIQLVGIDILKEREEVDDIIAIPLVRAFEWLVWSRVNFQDMIIYKNDNGIADRLILELHELSAMWKGIKNYIIRAVMRKNRIVGPDIVPYFDTIIQKEKEVLKIMEEVEGMLHDM